MELQIHIIFDKSKYAHFDLFKFHGLIEQITPDYTLTFKIKEDEESL